MYRFMVFTIIGNVMFVPFSTSVDIDCDYRQNMAIGTKYYIVNRQYPNNYLPSTSCRWIAESSENTYIVISCKEISIPYTPHCELDSLSISLTGNPNLKDGQKYCGEGSLDLETKGNSISIGFTAAANSTGGRFLCTITAQERVLKPPNCNCGYKMEKRIVGGHDSGVNEYPSMAGLVNLLEEKLYCGASIISPRYALTAAHCFSDKNKEVVCLLVGEHTLSTGKETNYTVLYWIASITIHPDYDNFQNDIAVVRTTMDIKFSKAVGPVCLPFNYQDEKFAGETVTALGWGVLQFGGGAPDILQVVKLKVLCNEKCDKESSPTYTLNITQEQIGTFSKGKDACQYDSGGPLLWQDPNTGRLQLVGIISYGIGCADDYPGVNTRVTSYLNWIRSVTPDVLYCEA